MDIDKLFKIPKLPSGGNKRRMPDNPTPEILKRMRMDPPSSFPSSVSISSSTSTNANSRVGASPMASTKSRKATVRDEEDEDMNADVEEQDSNGRQDFAPGNDADYFVEEDAEGRFFGGGLTDEQKKILSIFENAAAGAGEEEGALREDMNELNITSIRRILLRFERAVNKNQDQRSKYPDDPSKFIDSEADLDSAIKSILPLAQVPKLAYPELVQSGSVQRFVGLLSHENVDIVIDVVEVVHELTDEDVGGEADEDEDEDGDRNEGREKALKLLIDALLENSILELLVDNLPRLNESEESDRQGVFHILGVFENILGFNPSLSQLLVSKTAILKWLLTRIDSKTHDENRGYAAEILSILLQDSRDNRLALGREDGVEKMLSILSRYRKRDPIDADENEFMENVFDGLCSTLTEPEIKKLFLKSEGIDLMVLMMKERKESASRSLKILDHSMSGPAGTTCCETFVEALGLKSLFSAFMGKASKKSKSPNLATPASEETSHCLGILASLFSNLASETPARIRLMAKFVESNYEKVDRLLEIRENAITRMKITEGEIEAEKKELIEDGETIGPEEEDRWYLRRLDGGLYTLQTIDYILGWICMEDDGVRTHVQKMLARKSKSLKDLVDVLKVYRDNVGDETERVLVEEGEDISPSQKDILGALIAFLEGC